MNCEDIRHGAAACLPDAEVGIPDIELAILQFSVSCNKKKKSAANTVQNWKLITLAL